MEKHNCTHYAKIKYFIASYWIGTSDSLSSGVTNVDVMGHFINDADSREAVKFQFDMLRC